VAFPHPRRAKSVRAADRELDDQLLTLLYASHFDAVTRFVAGLVADAAQRDDIVQETFVRAWRNIGRIDFDTGNPRSFLFTIAQNIMVDEAPYILFYQANQILGMRDNVQGFEIKPGGSHYLSFEKLSKS